MKAKVILGVAFLVCVSGTALSVCVPQNPPQNVTATCQVGDQVPSTENMYLKQGNQVLCPNATQGAFDKKLHRYTVNCSTGLYQCNASGASWHLEQTQGGGQAYVCSR